MTLTLLVFANIIKTPFGFILCQIFSVAVHSHSKGKKNPDQDGERHYDSKKLGAAPTGLHQTNKKINKHKH